MLLSTTKTDLISACSLTDMGMGKTLTATRIAEEKEKPVLIIAPNALCQQWKDELTDKSDNRITTKDWNVLLCTSKTKNTVRFKQALEELCKGGTNEI